MTLIQCLISILRSTPESLILCSGTVFNQVVIWAPGQKQNAQGVVPILERIQAHDGVIFHIHFDFKSMVRK